jgi:hypothetical protein
VTQHCRPNLLSPHGLYSWFSARIASLDRNPTPSAQPSSFRAGFSAKCRSTSHNAVSGAFACGRDFSLVGDYPST